MHNSDVIIEFSQIVNAFVSVLSSEGCFSDLQSSSNTFLVVSKLPIKLNEQWLAFLERCTSVTNLVTFRDWLQQKAVVHERLLMSSGKQERSELKAPEKTKIKKHTVFAANTSSSTPNKALSCPVCHEVHKVWKCKWFLEKSVKDKIVLVREKKLCFSCLQSSHLSKDCTMNLKCVKKSCKKSHNVLLHLENSRTPATVIASGSSSENCRLHCFASSQRSFASARSWLEKGIFPSKSLGSLRYWEYPFMDF